MDLSQSSFYDWSDRGPRFQWIAFLHASQYFRPEETTCRLNLFPPPIVNFFAFRVLKKQLELNRGRRKKNNFFEKGEGELTAQEKK